MRTRCLFTWMMVLLSLLAMAAACGGGGGGGGGDGGGAPAPLATGTFVKNAHINSVGPWQGYFSTATTTIRAQSLYSGTTGTTQIFGSGYIAAIGFKAHTAVTTAFTCPQVSLKMGHTSLSTLTTTFANNVEQGKGSFVTVMQSKTITVPVVAAGEYFTIALDTPFYYNGADNLVVEFLRGGACTATLQLRYDSTVPADQTMYATDSLVSATGILTRPPNMQFHFSGGDNRVEYPSSVSDIAPFVADAALNHIQMLHLASALTGTGPITGIAIMSPETPTDAAHYTINVRLAHTVMSALTQTFADNYASGAATLVASNATFTVPAGVPAGTPIWLPITGSFNCNGTDNLIVDIEVLTADTTTTWRRDNSAVPNSRVYGAVGAATGTLNAGSYHTVFRFNGGTMDTVAVGGTYESYPFNSTLNPKKQYLYPAAVLGTKGSINKVAFRLHFDSVANTYNNVEIVMGHTDLNSLTTTFADNMTGATMVYNGSVSIPAGMKAGDWIEVPLGTAFAYDGTSNLVVQIAADNGSATNYLSLYGPSSQFAGYRLAWNDRTSATGQLANYLASQRLWLTKY